MRQLVLLVQTMRTLRVSMGVSVGVETTGRRRVAESRDHCFLGWRCCPRR